MLKICSCCKEEKDIKMFSKDKKRSDGYYVYCKPCVKIKSAKRYLENKDKINKQTKAWKENNKEYYLAQQREYHKKYSQSIPGKYREYKKGAFDRNYKWAITRKEFESFWQKPCYYCGTEIETIGLDRINNDLGYIKSNLVPCCSVCNRAKDTMTAEEYIEHCRRVSNIMR